MVLASTSKVLHDPQNHAVRPTGYVAGASKMSGEAESRMRVKDSLYWITGERSGHEIQVSRQVEDMTNYHATTHGPSLSREGRRFCSTRRVMRLLLLTRHWRRPRYWML
jgi:hypothetical protein